MFQGFLGRSDTTNAIIGKLKLGRETVATLEGHWDNKIVLKDKLTGVCGGICVVRTQLFRLNLRVRMFYFRLKKSYGKSMIK